MRLFISYARVDKLFCRQIIELLDMHDVWYDQRLQIGQRWWDEIVRRLHWCEGYVYLLSPYSVSSEYCRREFEIALTLGKRIFPVLIDKTTDVPTDIAHIQYADFTNGLDANAIKTLLAAIFIAEREMKMQPSQLPPEPNSEPLPLSSASQPVKPDGQTLFDDAVRAFERCDYDRAVFLLKHLIDTGFSSQFIPLATLLRQAETALERQAYMRDAQREYARIAILMRNETTRAMGCVAFRAFRITFPDYDPEDLGKICEDAILMQPPFNVATVMPLLEWCHIPPGKVAINRNRAHKTFDVSHFYVSKYPVTNAQFQAFIDAPDGYRDSAWWQSSLEVRRWHAKHSQPIPAPPNRENHPRAYVCWYEAMAFCQWLSYKTGWTVKLPTEQQWQRAAQGDTTCPYPWGNKFDKTLCNCKESDLHGTTLVTQYPKSGSPFGVHDMLGNVWEWCANGRATGEITDVTVDIQRAVRGSSYMTPRRHTTVNFGYHLNPLTRFQSIGFRIVAEADGQFPGI